MACGIRLNALGYHISFNHVFVLLLKSFQMTFGEQNTEKESHEMLSYAFEHGINCIDTAEAVSFFIFLFFLSTLGEYECKCFDIDYAYMI